MSKTMIFIDGSNFYRGMESFLIENKTGIFLKDYKFDFKSFIKAIGGDELIETRYYNVKLLRFENPERFKRQRNFFRKLEEIPNFKVSR